MPGKAYCFNSVYWKPKPTCEGTGMDNSTDTIIELDITIIVGLGQDTRH